MGWRICSFVKFLSNGDDACSELYTLRINVLEKSLLLVELYSGPI